MRTSESMRLVSVAGLYANPEPESIPYVQLGGDDSWKKLAMKEENLRAKSPRSIVVKYDYEGRRADATRLR